MDHFPGGRPIADAIVIDQIRTIDKMRITKTIGTLEDPITKKVKSVLKETFVD